MNISCYIRNNKNLKNLDFLCVYLTIIALVEDGKIVKNAFEGKEDVESSQS